MTTFFDNVPIWVVVDIPGMIFRTAYFAWELGPVYTGTILSIIGTLAYLVHTLRGRVE
jgi:hypothetical protein